MKRQSVVVGVNVSVEIPENEGISCNSGEIDLSGKCYDAGVLKSGGKHCHQSKINSNFICAISKYENMNKHSFYSCTCAYISGR